MRWGHWAGPGGVFGHRGSAATFVSTQLPDGDGTPLQFALLALMVPLGFGPPRWDFGDPMGIWARAALTRTLTKTLGGEV